MGPVFGESGGFCDEQGGWQVGRETWFSRGIALQLKLSVLLGLLAYFVAGFHALVSVFMGALAVMLGSTVAAFILKRSDVAAVALLNVLKAEAAKIFVVAVCLFFEFRFYSGLVPIALIVGLAGSALVSGATLQAVDDTDQKA